MATTISGYYLDELVDWNRLIAFYNNEMDEFESKLAEVIQRNTIPNIAAKVENEQKKLNAVSGKFYKLQAQIKQQESSLKTDSTLIEDAQIKAEMEQHQNELRRSMQQIEKEYIDVKYACYNFLSETLRKKKD
jgi:septal ring factor EnvC (AmiA/AmiB activator)